MSVGTIVGTVVGAVVGWFVGGPAGSAYLGAMFGAGLGAGIGMMVDPIRADAPAAGQPQGELQVSTAQEGVPIADLLGTSKMTGNIIWYGGSRSAEVKQSVSGGKGGGGGSEQTVGYQYYLSWAMGLLAGPVDALYAVYRDDNLVWSGELERPVSGGEATVALEGMGSMTFYFGTEDQASNVTLTGMLADATLNPPYYGLCYAFFDDCCIGDYNRAPTMRFVVRKSPVLGFNANNVIDTYDYNPAHALYHMLTEMVGLPEEYLHEDSFSRVADALYEELRGVSILFDRANAALGYIEALMQHIDGIVRYGVDGKFHLVLARGTQEVASLPVVDETMGLEDLAFERKTWLDTINEIKVQFVKRIMQCPDPEIGYTTQQMGTGESQLLWVEGEDPGRFGPYTWEVVSGGGTIEAITETTASYLAPAANPDCSYNPTIRLTDVCGKTDELQLAVSSSVSDLPVVAFGEIVEESGVKYVRLSCYKCDGTFCYFLYPEACYNGGVQGIEPIYTGYPIYDYLCYQVYYGDPGYYSCTEENIELFGGARARSLIGGDKNCHCFIRVQYGVGEPLFYAVLGWQRLDQLPDGCCPYQLILEDVRTPDEFCN